jgi:hypothetical protein
MTTSTPQWLRTVEKKRGLRDQAITRFSDGSDVAHQVPLYVVPKGSALNGLEPLHPKESSKPDKDRQMPSGIDDIKCIQQAISSGTVTASELCMAYISR